MDAGTIKAVAEHFAAMVVIGGGLISLVVVGWIVFRSWNEARTRGRNTKHCWIL
jgi:hypothetical protein